jgi:hypothetical protein
MAKHLWDNPLIDHNLPAYNHTYLYEDHAKDMMTRIYSIFFGEMPEEPQELWEKASRVDPDVAEVWLAVKMFLHDLTCPNAKEKIKPPFIKQGKQLLSNLLKTVTDKFPEGELTDFMVCVSYTCKNSLERSKFSS